MADNIKFTDGKRWEVKTNTLDPITLTTSPYTFAAVNQAAAGAERVFALTGTPTSKVFFLRGGSAADTLSKGIELTTNFIYIEDTFLGEIHFVTDSGTANLRVSIIITKE